MKNNYARITRFTTVQNRRRRTPNGQLRTALVKARAEAARLRAQLLRYHTDAAHQTVALLHTLPTAVLAESPEGYITLVNQRFCDLLGLDSAPALLMGQQTAAVLTQAQHAFTDYPRFATWAAACVAAGRRTAEGIFALNNGTVVQIDYLPLRRDNHTVLHLWNYENVTQQHHAQESIRRLSLLSERSPHPIICFSKHGEAQYTNAAAGPMLALLTAPHSEEHTLVRRMIAEALAAGTTRTAEHPLLNHFYIWTVVPLPNEQGANLYLTDISVRRRAEAELRRSQHFLTRINDTLPTLVFLYDVQQQRCVYCNDQVEALLGYTPQAMQQLPAEALRGLLHPDDADLTAHTMAAHFGLPEGEVTEADLRLRHRNGTWRWLSVKTTVFMRDDQGRVQQVLGAAENISARHAAEEALAHSQRFLERMADTVPNTIYLYDLVEHRNLYTNRNIFTTLGYTSEDMLRMGSRLNEHLVVPEDLPRTMAHYAALAAAANDDVLTLEYRLRHRNGSVRWIRLRDSVFARDAHGKVLQIIGAGEDITESHEAQVQRQNIIDQLAEQNRLFRQVIDSTPHLIYLKDVAGRYVLANQATAELYGLQSAQELVDTPPEHLPVSPHEAMRYLEQDRYVINHRRELDQEETFHRPDGSHLCFHSIKRPFVQANGTVLVLGVDSNITDLKQAQLELHAAKEAAEENARVKQEFLTNMSHEIRTPLNGILGMAGLLAKTELDPTQTDYLGHIRQSAEHLLVVINDVLATTQLGSGRLQLERIPFNLHTLLHDSLHSFGPRATEKGLDLLLDLPKLAHPPIVLGDPHRLRQVVLNLLGNALKFTERGHVLLNCQQLTHAPGHATFRISVTDTGIGIPQHQLEGIFEPFTQASASTAREYGGSGLGLSISRGLVELLGGRLWVQSEAGRGSTFFAELPLPFADFQTELPPPPAPDFQQLRGRRVLLVEDNAVNQLLVRTLLESWHMHVDTAANGPAALVLFGQYAYDAVLMDIQMPGMDGVAAAAHLRAHPQPERAATPIVALTAHALPEEEARCRAAGMDDYLAKPFREEQLFYVLRNAFVRGLLPSDETPAAEPSSGSELLDLPQLRQRMSGFDPAFARHMAQIFVQTTPPVLADLQLHLTHCNWQALSETAHYLKSSAEGLGLRALRPLLLRLEQCGPTPPQNAQEIAPLVHQLVAALEKVVSLFEREYPSAPTDVGAPNL
ncbi:PAS domain S-box protein [Hymenobacter koreensis]|uniref:histidine kinase n=1 Tax=Hymenobacter koreensis TaxID=1084523 RepID=A0ABP8JLR5_9BACT